MGLPGLDGNIVNEQSDLPPAAAPSWKVPEIMATVGPTLEQPEDLQPSDRSRSILVSPALRLPATSSR